MGVPWNDPAPIRLAFKGNHPNRALSPATCTRNTEREDIRGFMPRLSDNVTIGTAVAFVANDGLCAAATFLVPRHSPIREHLATKHQIRLSVVIAAESLLGRLPADLKCVSNLHPAEPSCSSRSDVFGELLTSRPLNEECSPNQ